MCTLFLYCLFCPPGLRIGFSAFLIEDILCHIRLHFFLLRLVGLCICWLQLFLLHRRLCRFLRKSHSLPVLLLQQLVQPSVEIHQLANGHLSLCRVLTFLSFLLFKAQQFCLRDTDILLIRALRLLCVSKYIQLKWTVKYLRYHTHVLLLEIISSKALRKILPGHLFPCPLFYHFCEFFDRHAFTA